MHILGHRMSLSLCYAELKLHHWNYPEKYCVKHYLGTFAFLIRKNHLKRHPHYYRPPEGGRLYDMKVVSGYAFLRTYYV